MCELVCNCAKKAKILIAVLKMLMVLAGTVLSESLHGAAT